MRSFSPTGPRSSIGLPRTSIIRPSVSVPTGTETGAPVSSTDKPLLNPSVLPKAIVRTTPSPSCCCTSKVISVPSTVSASYTCGTLSRSNSTSITAPIISTIRPLLIFGSSNSFNKFYKIKLNCCSSAGNFRQLLRNSCLSCLVIRKSQFLYQVTSII